LLLGGTPAFAQTARISGTVADQQGNVIQGASIQVTNQATGANTEATSGADGTYIVQFLPAGNYKVTITSPAFSPATSPVISITDGQASVFSPKLAIEGAATTEVVHGDTSAETIELGTASISSTLSENEVKGFGLNGRNFADLLSTSPGVSDQSGQDEKKVGIAGSAKFSVNGGRVEYNTYEVDGSDVLNTSINASRGQGEPLMVYPSIDAIEQMKVLSSNYSALYGKSASGSILITTKSGTDKFHGSAYEFLRNEIFNARNYFDQPDPEPLGYQGKLKYRTPLYRRQDFGGTIGGPLFIPHVYDRAKSKTFFFFSEEVRREKTPIDYNQAVPTAAERSGDFTDVCPVVQPGIPDTLNATLNPDCPRNGSAGNTIPQRTITTSYTAQGILNTGLIPMPNSVNGCNSTNPTALARCYVASVSPPTHWREELFRINHSVSDTEILSFRYIHDAWDTVTLTPQWGVVQNSFPTVENGLNGPGEDMVLLLTQSLPHGFLNIINAAYAVQHISLVPQSGPGLSSLFRSGSAAILDDASQGNINSTNNPNLTTANTITGTSCSQANGQTPTNTSNAVVQTLNECPMGYIFANGFGGDKMPGLIFQGTNGAYGGHGFAADTGYAPWNQSNPTFTLRDDANKQLGKHNLQFGAEALYVQQNALSSVSGADSGDLQGLLTFSNQQSRYTSGNAFADFMAGPGLAPKNGQTGALVTGLTQTGIKSYTQDSAQGRYYTRYKLGEFYLQDDWQILPHLSLNAGFRASLFGAWYNPKNTGYNWRPEAYNPSLGGSIQVDPNYGFLVETATANPIPLNVGSLDPVITNGLVQCGANGVPSGCMSNSLFQPSPRFGFSWDPFGDGKTAIRGGYGLFWEHGTGYESNVGSLTGSAPLILSETQSNIPSAVVSSNGVASSGSASAYNAIGFACQEGTTQCGTLPTYAGGTTYPLNVTSIPTKAVYSNTQQWSLSIQRELKRDLIVQAAYVGTKGTHLTAVRDQNQLSPLSGALNPFLPGQPITASVCSSGANYGYFSTSGVNTTNPPPPGGITSSSVIGPLSPGYKNMVVACTGNFGFAVTGGTPLGISADNVRPYPGFSNIISVNNVADSEYNALQATLRRTTERLTLGVAYTYSHSLDDSSDRSSANFANSLDIHSNHANSDFDQRHLLNVNYIYELPLVKLIEGFTHPLSSADDSPNAPFWTAGHALKTWLDHWQISGISVFATGTPFSVVNGGGADGTGTFDNAGVGDGLGVGSYADRMPNVSARGQRPFVPIGGQNEGPLLLNPGAFTAPQGLTFGNTGRNFLRNPSRTNFNMTLAKHFKPFGEKADIEFRAEGFNIFNHTQFRLYDPAHPGNSGNNVINCYGNITTQYSAGASSCLNGNSFLHPVDAHDPRILQFALKMSY